MKRFIRIMVISTWLGAHCLIPLAFCETPSLTLEDSIPVAQEAITKAKLNLADYFLYSITYSHSSKGNFWYYTIRAKQPSEYNQIYIKIYMDGSTEFSGGPFSRR